MADEGRVERSATSNEVLSGDSFRRLAELSPDGLLAHREGRVVWANLAAAKLVGYSEAAQLVGKSIFDFVKPKNREAVAEDIARAFASAEGNSYQATFVRSDGSTFEAELRRAPIGGGLMLVVVRDLAGHRSQRSAELRARAFFDATTGAMGISRMGVHVEANRAYAKLFGIEDPAELVGVPILELIDPSEHARIKELVGRRGRGEQVPVTYSVLSRRRDGSTFMMEVTASSYLDGEEHVTIVLVRDLTAQLAEEARRSHRERLEAIGRLAGGVAHDFNNILAAILTNTELSLETSSSSSPLHDNLTLIREATLRAGELVRQILTFGRRGHSAASPLDLAQAVTQALNLVRAGVPSSVELEVDVVPVGGTVLGDATQVHQIVMNLCSNARDAVGASGHIKVSLRPFTGPGEVPELSAGHWARLRVLDDGVGMDAATRAHLFEPYHTTRAEQGGHGLGLAVVHGIVSSLGAVIQVESRVGHGSTFDVYFPLSEEPVKSEPKVAASTGAHERLMLVEDEGAVRSAVKRLLSSLGYVVSVAVDGAEALEQLRAKPGSVDLVLSDISMPRLTGVELARALHAEQPGVKVILYSGFSDILAPAEARALGIRALLGKPIGREELAAALREALGPVPPVS
jgi:PAS domain S-box-containing protein